LYTNTLSLAQKRKLLKVADFQINYYDHTIICQSKIKYLGIFGMNKDGIYLFLVGVKQQSLTHSIPRYIILDWHIIVWS
jgi:hypothetical protein